MQKQRPPLLRWVGEFVLIVGSVFLAVYLEGASQRRAEHEAARVALAQLLGELREDLLDFDRIIAHQTALDSTYSDIHRWLGQASGVPLDSLEDALVRVSVDNFTLFPRRASWATMVNSGQLTDLDAPELVLLLGKLYETAYARIDYNSSDYDESLQATLLASRTGIHWHTLGTDPLSDDRAAVAEVASALEWIHITWNVWYRDLLVEYRPSLQEAILAVEAELDRGGR